MYFCHSDLLPNKDISYRSSVIQKSFRVKKEEEDQKNLFDVWKADSIRGCFPEKEIFER